MNVFENDTNFSSQGDITGQFLHLLDILDWKNLVGLVSYVQTREYRLACRQFIRGPFLGSTPMWEGKEA